MLSKLYQPNVIILDAIKMWKEFCLPQLKYTTKITNSWSFHATFSDIINFVLVYTQPQHMQENMRTDINTHIHAVRVLYIVQNATPNNTCRNPCKKREAHAITRPNKQMSHDTIDWCYFYYLVRNNLVALLEAVCANVTSHVSESHIHTISHAAHLNESSHALCHASRKIMPRICMGHVTHLFT